MVASSCHSRSARGPPTPGVSHAKTFAACLCCRLGFTREDALKRFIFVQEVGKGGVSAVLLCTFSFLYLQLLAFLMDSALMTPSAGDVWRLICVQADMVGSR